MVPQKQGVRKSTALISVIHQAPQSGDFTTIISLVEGDVRKGRSGYFSFQGPRGASSTAAFEKGVLIEDILCTADWSTDFTFRRFYYRPSHQNNYAQAVLQARSGSS